MAFDSNQLGMAIFLLIAAIFNLWFVSSSCRRAFFPRPTPTDDANSKNNNNLSLSPSYQLLSYAVVTMASFDILWVWLCMIQCWNNTFHLNEFNQNSGEDSFGCKFMGWYSSFSLVSMMGSHCLVVYYLMNYFREQQQQSTAAGVEVPSFLKSTKGWLTLSTTLLVAACLFASMPLMQGDGYALTSGGYCYADFTNVAQAATILFFTLAFLTLSTALWTKIGRWREYWYYYTIFVGTWILWIPAASYGIAMGEEIASPYMLIGAIVGHANAIINPLLYGRDLFRKVEKDGTCDDVGGEFKEAPDIA